MELFRLDEPQVISLQDTARHLSPVASYMKCMALMLEHGVSLLLLVSDGFCTKTALLILSTDS